MLIPARNTVLFIVHKNAEEKPKLREEKKYSSIRSQKEHCSKKEKIVNQVLNRGHGKQGLDLGIRGTLSWRV